MSTQSNSIEQHSWLVLLASSPQKTEYRLQQWNMQEEQKGNPASFRLFVPFTAMETEGAAEEKPDAGLSLRAALRRYVFVEGNEELLHHLMLEWNKLFEDKLFFLKTGSKANAHIRQSDMDKLQKACMGDAGRMDMSASLADVKPGQMIRLVNTPFENDDCEYEVVSVKKKTGGTVELQVKMVMFGIEFDHITVTYTDTADSKSNASLVSSAQKRLLEIFRRRVNHKETPVTEYEDQKALTEIFAQSNTVFREGAMKRHFLALMLICSHMMGDEAAVNRFRIGVEKELEDISRIRESKAATDTRAYLHISLYIATKQPKWRDLAKVYVRKYNPSSTHLRQFVSTMSKREASKFIGPKARK